MNQSCGEKSKEELDAKFGEGNCTFIFCDVSDADALKGKRRCGVSAPTDHTLLTPFQLNREVAAARKTMETFIVLTNQKRGLGDD